MPLGAKARVNFGRIDEVLDMPDLIEIQRKSYDWFLKDGLKEMFRDISPITDFTGNLVLEFLEHRLDQPKYDVAECRERDVTYAAPLRVKVRLINKEGGEIREAKEQEVFMGDFPLMTEKGTFIINGAERVVVSQLVRSPGAYYSEQVDPNGKRLYFCTLIPNRGAWLEFESDSNDILWVRVDRTRKIPVTVLLRAFGYGTREEILSVLGESSYILNTLDKDTCDSEDEALVEIYKRLRPGEPPTVESARSLLESLFFETRRYDLAGVGRYKLNKKLSLKRRLPGTVAVSDIRDSSGELIVAAGATIDRKAAERIEAAGINQVEVQVTDGSKVKVISNARADEGPPPIQMKVLTKEDVV
ncbi:MAG: DNA-directed RNA polymerase subunit beta, partial [Bacillota bacterium]